MSGYPSPSSFIKVAARQSKNTVISYLTLFITFMLSSDLYHRSVVARGAVHI